MTKLTGVTAATTAGLLMLVAPAQAAPTAPAAADVKSAAAPSAAEIEANNAAARASLPPNVTMEVIGKLPKLYGPTYHYSQEDPSGVTILALKTLPYSFTFTGVRSITGATTFKPTKTKVCKDIEATWDGYHDAGHGFKVELNGGAVSVPPDGIARSWCWSGLTTGKTYAFEYYTTGNSEGHYAYVSGSGQVRYP